MEPIITINEYPLGWEWLDKEQVLKTEQGCEDHYLFICKNSQKNLQPDRSLLDVLELNEEVNDIFSNQRLTGILGSIAYDSESLFTVKEDVR